MCVSGAREGKDGGVFLVQERGRTGEGWLSVCVGGGGERGGTREGWLSVCVCVSGWRARRVGQEMRSFFLFLLKLNLLKLHLYCLVDCPLDRVVGSQRLV